MQLRDGLELGHAKISVYLCKLEEELLLSHLKVVVKEQPAKAPHKAVRVFN
jgi:hypothetical protein